MEAAVINAMKESGKSDQISAKIRAEIFRLLIQDSPQPQSVPLCRENLIINELIREYLEHENLTETLDVFLKETGQPIDPMDRQFLAHSLGITNSSSTLLNGLVEKWEKP